MKPVVFILKGAGSIKYFIAALVLIFAISKAAAQANNIYMDGDNYITLNNPAFASRLDWNDFSNTAPLVAQQPIVTYWFVHNGKSHIVIHLKTGNSEIFMELSLNKSIYQFPANITYTPADNPGQYRFNDFWLYVADKSGAVRKFVLAKNTHLTVHVQQLAPARLKIDFEGTIDDYPHPHGTENGPLSAPMAITGKISLSKKSPLSEHLPDGYAGCDNNIYNEVSPNWKLGQWYSANECEELFYRKVFAALNEAMKPVFIYFKTNGWKVSQTMYRPLDVRLKQAETAFFNTNPFPYSPDYTLTADANAMKGAYHDYFKRYGEFMNSGASLIKNGHLDTATVIKSHQFANEGKEFSLKLEICLNRPLRTDGYPENLDMMPVKKLSDSVYLINKVISTNIQMLTYYDAYLLIGKWDTPKWTPDRDITAAPLLPENAKKLSIQTIFIRLDCGKNLANTVISHINIDELKKMLNITP